MSAAGRDHALTRGSGLLIAHCHAFGDFDERVPVVDRLRQLIGHDLTRLLLVALAGQPQRSSRI
jgi:hypothetical protein